MKVLDFGLAKAMSEDPVKSELSESPTITRDATATGVILGTAAYMSPEQARGKTVDKRTDICAFGCCLYEALTGRMVFQGDTLSDTIAGILERDPDWKALPEPTTPGVRVVLRRCLQKDANRRLHDIADARIEMEEALTEPSMTPAEAIAHRPALRRWQAIPWIVAAFATAVAIWFVMLGSPPSTVTTRLRLSTPPLNARGSALAISPDGRRLAFLADDSGTNKLFLHSMDKLDAEPVAGTDGAWEPFFSPDGEWVGFFADFFNEGDDYGVPTLWVFSWYDISVMPNIELFNYVRKNGTDPEVRDNQFMVVSTMPHCAMGRETEQTVVGERFLGDARYDYQTLFVRWFDRWLKGEDNGVTNRPKVESYLMGKNEWRRYDGWPHPETNFVTYYLASSGDANSSLGDGRLATVKPSSSAHDTFVYDPGHPVPSLGGGFCCMGTDAVPGAFDQSYLELRRDVLVYTSEPLEEGVNVTGPIEVMLYVSSDAKDTDFAVKILDVYPDGTAYNLDDSIQGARYREGYDKEVFMKPGEVYEVKVGPLGTSNFFKKGHRIRIDVSSSNFPRYGRNLNTGGRDYDETEWKTANNSVHHSARYPSRIVLPIVPE